jgi:hypothetical protein
MEAVAGSAAYGEAIVFSVRQKPRDLCDDAHIHDRDIAVSPRELRSRAWKQWVGISWATRARKRTALAIQSSRLQ